VLHDIAATLSAMPQLTFTESPFILSSFTSNTWHELFAHSTTSTTFDNRIRDVKLVITYCAFFVAYVIFRMNPTAILSTQFTAITGSYQEVINEQSNQDQILIKCHLLNDEQTAA
jgi:hypothetical protein